MRGAHVGSRYTAISIVTTSVHTRLWCGVGVGACVRVHVCIHAASRSQYSVSSAPISQSTLSSGKTQSRKQENQTHSALDVAGTPAACPGLSAVVLVTTVAAQCVFTTRANPENTAFGVTVSPENKGTSGSAEGSGEHCY